MKHGKLKAGIAALLAVAIIASGSLVGWSAAYFTDTKEVNRTFTFGTVDIILEEPDFPPDPPPSMPNEPTGMGKKMIGMSRYAGNHCHQSCIARSLSSMGRFNLRLRAVIWGTGGNRQCGCAHLPVPERQITKTRPAPSCLTRLMK